MHWPHEIPAVTEMFPFWIGACPALWLGRDCISADPYFLMCMKFPELLLTAAIIGASGLSPLTAAVLYTNGSYSQSFDSLSGVTTWANDSTLVGWYAATTATATISAIGSNTGSTTTAGLYSFGVAGTNPITERALGYSASNTFTGASGTGKGYLGIQFTNDNIVPLTEFTLTYDGEQWRRDNTVAQTIGVEYSLDATSLTTGTWTSAGSSLTFSSPQFVGGAGLLDGNASANKSIGLTGTVSSIAWAPSANLWVRFVDLNDSGNDHQLAIDNVTFSAVPEPAAALLGAIGLIGLLRRRR